MPKKFDKKEYDKQYVKDNYKQIAFRCKNIDVDYIKEFAQIRGLSIPNAIILAFKYIDENGIKLDKSNK